MLKLHYIENIELSPYIQYIASRYFTYTNDVLCPAADISGVDWMVRHGRSLALANAVKSAPEQLYAEEYRDTVAETILTNATADRVSRGNVTNRESHLV